MILVEGDADVDDVDAFVAELDAIGGAHGCAVTAIDARYVAGRAHLAAAVERANRAVAREDAIADDRAIEVLLYAAGRRQIERALAMGVEAGRGPVAIVVDSGGDPAADEAGAADALRGLVDECPVIGPARDDALVREFFGIADAELAATDAPLCDLVVERVSLLAVEK